MVRKSNIRFSRLLLTHFQWVVRVARSRISASCCSVTLNRLGRCLADGDISSLLLLFFLFFLWKALPKACWVEGLKSVSSAFSWPLFHSTWLPSRARGSWIVKSFFPLWKTLSGSEGKTWTQHAHRMSSMHDSLLSIGCVITVILSRGAMPWGSFILPGQQLFHGHLLYIIFQHETLFQQFVSAALDL